MNAPIEDKETSAVREAAAEWVVRMSGNGFSQADDSEFAAWLRRSPLHVKEYLRAEAVWFAMEGAARSDSTRIQTLLQDARGNVVDLHEHLALDASGAAERTVLVPKAATERRSWRMGAALAASLVLLIGAALAWQWFAYYGPNSYATGVGEHQRVMLEDGSAMELNTRTRVSLHFTSQARDVFLHEGEAFFTVARDPSRPFRVLSDSAVVRAIGTEFNVYRQSDRTVVTVIEGKIEVTHRTPGQAASGGTAKEPAPVAEPVEVGAGVSADVRATAAIQTRSASPGTVIAWRQRRVVFENETLATVAAEFNRYNTRQLIIEDPALASERVTGTFDPTAPDDLIDFLTENGDAVSVESGARIVLRTTP